MRRMNSESLARLHELRRIRSGRQQDIVRIRQLALDQAVAALESARARLTMCQRGRADLEIELYAPLIGKKVILRELLTRNATMISAHDRERLLERRLEEAVADTEHARRASEAAYNAARQLYREQDKCTHLLRGLRASEVGRARKQE